VGDVFQDVQNSASNLAKVVKKQAVMKKRKKVCRKRQIKQVQFVRRSSRLITRYDQNF